jgi:hypothetical protein
MQMIETNYFILDKNMYQESYNEANKLGVSIDYFLLEWCEIEGEDVYV